MGAHLANSGMASLLHLPSGGIVLLNRRSERILTKRVMVTHVMSVVTVAPIFLLLIMTLYSFALSVLPYSNVSRLFKRFSMTYTSSRILWLKSKSFSAT